MRLITTLLFILICVICKAQVFPTSLDSLRKYNGSFIRLPSKDTIKASDRAKLIQWLRMNGITVTGLDDSEEFKMDISDSVKVEHMYYEPKTGRVYSK
jgi:hypothetical protein